LKSLGLQYEVMRDWANGMDISPLWHSEAMNLSEISASLSNYGEVDRVRHVGKDYAAYVDRNGQIVYVENSFVFYDSPS
jgi:hypothetical protein